MATRRILLVVPRTAAPAAAGGKLQNMANATLSAYAGRAAADIKNDFQDLMLPTGFDPDTSFGVLPLGPDGNTNLSGRLTRDDAIRSFLQESERFLVRGFIDVPGGDRIPDSLPVPPNGRTKAQVFLDLDLQGHLTCGTSRPVGTTSTVRTKLGVKRIIDNGLDGTGVAVALVDTGINLPYLLKKLADEQERAHPAAGFPPVTINIDPNLSWRPDGLASQPFHHHLDHGTMTAYDLLIAAPKATLLDYPMLSTRAPGDQSVRGTIGAAMIAYAHLAVHWIFYSFFELPKPKYNTLVVNNSWGIYNPNLDDFPPGSPGRYIDNPNHVFRNFIMLLTAFDYDIVFCAGNCGSDCPAPPCLHCTTGTINGASAYPEVLTLAGCDVTDTRVGYSSQGPAIAGMPQPQKPDVTAYTHFLGSGVRARWLPDAGTSASAPMASGCIAALRTLVDPTAPGQSPADMFAAFRNTALSRPTAPGWNRDYGFGIINPVAVGRQFGVIP
jgi:hypothetical protein